MQFEVRNGIRVLRAEPGKRISDAGQTVYASEIWLGKDDNPDNYIEVDVPPTDEPQDTFEALEILGAEPEVVI